MTLGLHAGEDLRDCIDRALQYAGGLDSELG
jgi:hypothetical protein